MNTMQEEFDAVVAHLYTQGRPAKVDTTAGSYASCRYRAGTLSCAVGCRIPDATYVEGMDQSEGGSGTGVLALLARFGEVLPPEIKAYQSLFIRLQGVHDGAITTFDGGFLLPNLEEELRRVADFFKLTFTVPATKGE